MSYDHRSTYATNGSQYDSQESKAGVSMWRKMADWVFNPDPEEAPPEPGPAPEAPKGASSMRRPKTFPFPRHTDEIFVRRPRSQEDAKVCVDCLHARAPVVLNLGGLEDGKARRIFDFLLGAVYAVGGHMQEVGETIFLLTPRDIAISQEGENPEEPADEGWDERLPRGL